MLKSFLKIIKWKNILHIVAVQFLIKYCFLSGYSFQTKLTLVDLILLSITTVSILSSGYLYSYSLLPNRPYEVFSKKHAYRISLIFGSIGLGLGTYLSFFIGKPEYSLIILALFSSIFIYFKFTRTKNFFTNIATSYTRVFSVLLVWWFDYPLTLNSVESDLFFKLQIATISLVIYSFFANIIRDILFDIKNTNKDFSNKQSTIPVVLGRKSAKDLVKTILVVVSAIIIITTLIFIRDRYLLLTIFFTINIPQLWLIYHLTIANTEKQYNSLLRKSNIAYYATFSCVPFLTYYFKYVI